MSMIVEAIDSQRTTFDTAMKYFFYLYFAFIAFYVDFIIILFLPIFQFLSLAHAEYILDAVELLLYGNRNVNEFRRAIQCYEMSKLVFSLSFFANIFALFSTSIQLDGMHP